MHSITDYLKTLIIFVFKLKKYFYGILFNLMNEINKFTINKNSILEKTAFINKKNLKINRIEKFKKYFCYSFAAMIPAFYIFYFFKSSGLLKKLEVDKKYNERKKRIEDSFGVDSKLNDVKIEEFDKKWGINKANDDYEEKIKYGNTALNAKDEIKVISIDETTNLTNEISSEVTQEKIIILNTETKNQSNPLEVESNVFFDSRLDNLNKKK